LKKYLSIDEDTAENIVIYFSAFFGDNLNEQIQIEIDSLCSKKNINYDEIVYNVVSDFADYQFNNFIDSALTPNVIDTTLKLLKFHLLSILEDSHSTELYIQDSALAIQILFDENLKYEALQSLSFNESIISDKKISDWIKEFENMIKEDYQSSLISKNDFINNQNLSVEDKNLLSKVLDIYLRIKFSPKSFDNITDTDYFIIPHIKVLSGQIEVTNEAIVNLLDQNLYDLLNFKEPGLDHRILNAYLSENIDDEKFRKSIENALYNNNEQITDKNIKIESGEVGGTASNWLKDYIERNTIERYDDIAFSSYILDSENTKTLTEEERTIVKRLLQFYLNIKFYSQVFVGIDRENWNLFPVEFYVDTKKKKVFVPESIKEKIEQKPEKKVSQLEILLDSYKNFELEFRDLEAQLTKELKLKKTTDLDEEFLNFVNHKQSKEAMVVLSYVCKNNLLSIFFKDNKILQQEFRKFLELRFSDDIVNNIFVVFGTVATVSLFLQFLLIEKLKLIPKDVGLFGMYLASAFKKSGQAKYFPIVYGDVNSGMFVFREIKDVAGKLQIE